MKFTNSFLCFCFCVFCLLTATGRGADVGRGAPLEAAWRCLAAGAAAWAAAAATARWQKAGKGEQRLEQLRHVGVLLRRALEHLGPARKE